MAALVTSIITINPIINRPGMLNSSGLIVKPKPSNFGIQQTGVRFSNFSSKVSSSNSQSSDGTETNSVQELSVPNHWLDPSKAAEESEWLRVTLHRWLDDEYCPEATNVEISKVAADSFFKCLMEKQVDLGVILLKMALELESISYQESFHGAFSSANAAVNLIVQRISLD